MINPGMMKHRIEILKIVKEKDEFGALTNKTKTVARVWASINGLSGREVLQAGQAVMETTHKIYCRYNQNIKPDCKIRFGKRIFEIEHIQNYREANDTLYILAKELHDYTL